jgi:hypothetical protein
MEQRNRRNAIAVTYTLTSEAIYNLEDLYVSRVAARGRVSRSSLVDEAVREKYERDIASKSKE